MNKADISDQDFLTIYTAVYGCIDWERIVIILAQYEYNEALRMIKNNWPEAEANHTGKAEKLLSFLGTFKKMNMVK